MVERWFADDLLDVTKRGAILNRPNSKLTYYWPGDVYPNGERIVRIPYSLNFGFLSRLFGEIKKSCQSNKAENISRRLKPNPKT